MFPVNRIESQIIDAQLYLMIFVDIVFIFSYFCYCLRTNIFFGTLVLSSVRYRDAIVQIYTL